MKKLFSDIPCIRGENIELRRLTAGDAPGLRELTESEDVYRFLPTFLFEKKYDSAEYTISLLYDECLEESLILGIFKGGEFCGLAEFYGYRPAFLKMCVGYRLLPRFWGKGTATEALGLMVNYLFNETGIKIITASVLPENKASAGVLKKNGFKCSLYSVPENWGYEKPLKTDKWLLTAAGYHRDYRFRNE